MKHGDLEILKLLWRNVIKHAFNVMGHMKMIVLNVLSTLN